MTVSDDSYICYERLELFFILVVVRLSRHTERFPPNFPALVAYFIPSTVVHLIGAITQLSSQNYNLRNDQFCHTARIAERRVEYSDSVVCGILQVYLVGSNAKAANNDEVACFFQDSRRELGFRPDANDMHIPGIQTNY
jgi:hypothetical protein